jgi:glycosyltransferase involved in cell wall biosynthesis
MSEAHPGKSSRLFASVIIAAYNDWRPLVRCLHALGAQVGAPPFEILVVDDGSTEPVPASIRDWSGPSRFALISHPHSGAAAARNQGIRRAAGEVLVFVDADCVPQNDCLAALAACVKASSSDYFQLRLAGEKSNPASRAEELRLIATQDFLLQSDGRIRFLNTAGFAVRRTAVDTVNGLFEERALRGEDTLLLADLLRRNQLPLFVPSAVVRHVINMSVMQCLSKDVRTALLEAKTHAIIATRDIGVRIGYPERFRMLRSMWEISKDDSIGRAACLLLVARQMVRLVILAVCEVLPGYHSQRPEPTVP